MYLGLDCISLFQKLYEITANVPVPVEMLLKCDLKKDCKVEN